MILGAPRRPEKGWTMGIAQVDQMTKIWIYVDTRYHVGHPDHIKAFADPEAADRWFQANDPEGTAFEYEVIG
jgi:hypothetical protein